jgi:2-aminoethylphosphonate transport system ATP-binding protein
VIELEHVTVRRGGHTLLADVSLAVGDEVVALVGPSGAGKSTLIRAILGLDGPPTSGVVRIVGRRLDANGRQYVLPEDRDVAVVFQDLALWPHMSVRDNLEFGLRAHAVPRAARAERVAEALSWVGMLGQAKRAPHELSGGERQRVAIARALVASPVAILLDEPLGNLDVLRKDELLGLFEELFARRRIPVLYVTHDPREAARLAHRIVVLEDARIVQQGTLADLESSAPRTDPT